MTEPDGYATRVPVPEWLARQADHFTEIGGPPTKPRRAATVILLRPASGSGFSKPARGTTPSFEVYAQRRPATMAFAPNMYVFPGGTLDERDAGADVAWVGPGAQWWAERLAMAEGEGQAVVCAAVREVFEECGVLLAGPDESTVVGDVSGTEWEEARAAVIAREVGFADLLGSYHLAIRSDLLAPWARWLTPEFEPRRYDTYFFVARLPTDQRTRDGGGESTHSVWVRPADALHLPMLPPTALTLRQLAAYETIDAILAASVDRVLAMARMPRARGRRRRALAGPQLSTRDGRAGRARTVSRTRSIDRRPPDGPLSRTSHANTKPCSAPMLTRIVSVSTNPSGISETASTTASVPMSLPSGRRRRSRRGRLPPKAAAEGRSERARPYE